jgi:small subunit ribosomal protein S1
MNKKRGNIVLSRRALLEEQRQNSRAETLKKLEEGSLITGIVKNITEYGIFVDLGGIDGLLHITDMSWGRVNHPSEMFSMGDKLDVMVLKFDKEKERVSLGLKQITADPWVDVDEKYPVKTHIKGKVVSITDYGIFVELEKGIEGLVHISEMSWSRHVKHPSKIVSIRDEVEAVVLTLDTLFQLNEYPIICNAHHFPLDVRFNRVFFIYIDPRVGSDLFESERNALFFFVEFEYHHI